MKENNKDQKEKVEIKERRNPPKSHVGGILLVVIGLILLLNNFGIISWSVWDILWKLWPLFLILWGVEALLGEDLAGRIILVLLSLALAIFLILQILSLYNFPIGNFIQPYFQRMPMQNYGNSL